MRYWHEAIDCKSHFQKTKREAPFIVIGYQFNYSIEEDKQILDCIISSSIELSGKVNAGAANDSTIGRSRDRLLANCLAGMSSEYCWKHFLNFKKECVRTTSFVSAACQIDLEIIANLKRIEVRSSFPRNGVPFAICHPVKEFDILGPYSNMYKPGEINKDYYVRTLFPFEHPTDIIEKIKSEDFTLFLTGGATFDMMFDPKLSLEKDLIPEDSFGVTQKTSYRVVPFHLALDCKELYKLITQET